MLTRIISAAVALVLFLGVYIAPPVVLKLAFCLLGAVGIYEIYKAYSLRRYIPLLICAFASAPVFVFGEYTKGAHMDGEYLLNLAAKAEDGAWKQSKLEKVKQYMLNQLKEFGK